VTIRQLHLGRHFLVNLISQAKYVEEWGSAPLPRDDICDINNLMHSVADFPPTNRNNRLPAYISAKTFRWHSGWDRFDRRPSPTGHCDGILFDEDDPRKIEQAREIMRAGGREICDGIDVGVASRGVTLVLDGTRSRQGAAEIRGQESGTLSKKGRPIHLCSQR
jgi:hypothetical protein